MYRGSNTGPHVETSGTSSRVLEFKTVSAVMKWLERQGLIADSSSYSRTQSWLTRERDGNSVDLRSPFFSQRSDHTKGERRTLKWDSRESIRDKWWNVLSNSSAKDSLSPEYHKVFFTDERGALEAISEQSTFLPWVQDGPDKVAQIYSDKPKSERINGRAFDRAYNRVLAMLPVDSIRMTSILDAISGPLTAQQGSDTESGMDVTTNSGLPYTKGPWRPREVQPPHERADSKKAFDFIVDRSKSMLETLRTGQTVELYALVAKRLAQKSDVMKRKRIVIALEKAEPVLVKTFSPALLSQLSKHPEFVALRDLPSIDLHMQAILKAADDGNRAVISGDYSGYDASLPPWFIELGGSIVAKWVSKGFTWVNALVKSMVHHTVLVTPNAVWPSQPSSMKSGSGLTNLLDSICNLLVIYYGEEVGAWKVVNTCVQGDDFLLDGIGASPAKVSEIASLFGLSAHPDKQMYVPHMLQFLQRTHVSGLIGGVARTSRVLGSIISYERLKWRSDEWNGYTDIVRARAQLENAAFSPWFEDLVKFVRSGDKFQLGQRIDPSELLKLGGSPVAELLERRSGAQSLMIGERASAFDGFKSSAVGGVLNGEVMPPFGTLARFKRVYGKRAETALNG